MRKLPPLKVPFWKDFIFKEIIRSQTNFEDLRVRKIRPRLVEIQLRSADEIEEAKKCLPLPPHMTTNPSLNSARRERPKPKIFKFGKVAYTSEFGSARIGTTSYSFTTNESLVLKFLHDRAVNAFPEVTIGELQEELLIKSKSIKEIFKKHPVEYKLFVKKGSVKGKYMLNPN